MEEMCQVPQWWQVLGVVGLSVGFLVWWGISLAHWFSDGITPLDQVLFLIAKLIDVAYKLIRPIQRRIQMFSRLFTSRLRMELAEIKHKHGLEMKEAQAQIELERKMWVKEKELLTKELTKTSELKLTEMVALTKLEGQQKAAKAELDAQAKVNDAVKKLNDEQYQALKDAMTKLHQEGDVNSEFTRELALKMIESMPKNSSETKVLTGSIDVKA